MQVIRLAITRQELAAHRGEHLLGMALQPVERRVVEHLAAIFRDADQMYRERRNAVSFASEFLHWRCRPIAISTSYSPIVTGSRKPVALLGSSPGRRGRSISSGTSAARRRKRHGDGGSTGRADST